MSGRFLSARESSSNNHLEIILIPFVYRFASSTTTVFSIRHHILPYSVDLPDTLIALFIHFVLHFFTVESIRHLSKSITKCFFLNYVFTCILYHKCSSHILITCRSYLLLSYDVAVIQCHKNRMTTHYITFWRVHVMS